MIIPAFTASFYYKNGHFPHISWNDAAAKENAAFSADMLKLPRNTPVLCNTRNEFQMKHFEEVALQFEGMIHYTIRKLRIYKDFEHFKQVGLIGLWKAYEAYDELRGDFPPMAARYIQTEMITELRKMKRYEDKQICCEDDTLTFHSESQAHLEIEQSVLLKEAMQRILTPDEYRFLYDYFTYGMKLDELAAKHNMTKGTMTKKKAKLLLKLRQAFQE